MMVLLAAFVLIALLPLILSKIDDEKPTQPPVETRVKFTDIFKFFRTKGTGRWVLVLAIYYSGILGILALLKPWMVDLGYSVKEIAFMVGIYGTGCGAAGAFVAGFIVKFLGQRKSMILFSCYSLFAASLFLYLNYTTISKADLYAAIAILWTAYSMSSVLIYTVSMGKTRKGKEGTDYSIQIVISHLQGILIAMLAGKTYDLFGPKTLMLAETTMASLVVIIVIFSPKVVAETRELSPIQPEPHENAR
ncbi:MAG: MFS transporter [Bacteroidales bacterium]|nr:MFS transporter [Bacteroidales bacterium]